MTTKQATPDRLDLIKKHAGEPPAYIHGEWADVRWLVSEVERLREEVAAWKEAAGEAHALGREVVEKREWLRCLLEVEDDDDFMQIRSILAAADALAAKDARAPTEDGE